MEKNNKNLLIIISIVAFLALAGGYFYWKTRGSLVKQAVENIQEASTGVAEDVSKSVFPEINTGTINPLENVQSANPYKETNPFSTIKVNPFK